MVGLPDLHPNAQGVEGESPLVVGQLPEICCHGAAPRLQLGQPGDSVESCLVAGEYLLPLCLEGSDLLTECGELVPHHLGRVGVQEPKIRRQVRSPTLRLSDPLVNGGEVRLGWVVYGQPLKLVADGRRVEQQGLDPLPDGVVKHRADNSGARTSILEALAATASVAEARTVAMDHHRSTAVATARVATSKQGGLWLGIATRRPLDVQTESGVHRLEDGRIDEWRRSRRRQRNRLIHVAKPNDALVSRIAPLVLGDFDPEADAFSHVRRVDQDATDGALPPFLAPASGRRDAIARQARGNGSLTTPLGRRGKDALHDPRRRGIFFESGLQRDHFARNVADVRQPLIAKWRLRACQRMTGLNARSPTAHRSLTGLQTFNSGDVARDRQHEPPLCGVLRGVLDEPRIHPSLLELHEDVHKVVHVT